MASEASVLTAEPFHRQVSAQLPRGREVLPAGMLRRGYTNLYWPGTGSGGASIFRS